MQLKIVSSKEIHKSKVLTLIEERVQHPNGSEYTHLSVRHPGAVVIVPVDNDGSLLVLEQYRHSIKSMLLEFPAGTINPGEQPAVCAVRELEEEVAKKASEWKDLGTIYPAPGFCNELQFLYLAKGLSEGVGNLDADEIIKVKRLSISNVEDAIRSGQMKDAKSISAFFRARLMNLI